MMRGCGIIVQTLMQGMQIIDLNWSGRAADIDAKTTAIQTCYTLQRYGIRNCMHIDVAVI